MGLDQVILLVPHAMSTDRKKAKKAAQRAQEARIEEERDLRAEEEEVADGAGVRKHQTLTRPELIKLMAHIAPPLYYGSAGTPDSLMDFLDGGDRLVQQEICETDNDLLMVVSYSLRGDAASFYKTWLQTTNYGDWSTLREDICRRFLGQSFRMQSVRELLSIREQGSDLMGFVQGFRRVHEKLQLARFNPEDDLMQAMFVAKLSEEHAKQVTFEENDSLEETLIAAERYAANILPSRTRAASAPVQPAEPGHKQRKVEEVGLPQPRAAPSASAPNSGQGGWKGKARDYSGFECRRCHKMGHIERHCPEPKAQ